MKSKKYFVVGGRGYIGAKLYSSIPNELIRFRTSSSELEGYLLLNLALTQDSANLPIDNDDVVFLTAAISAPDICANDYEKTWRLNVTGTNTFIASAINRGARVIFFSSDTVYGECVDEFDERAGSNPMGEYAEMKHEVEKSFSGNNLFKSIRLSYVFSREDKFSRYLIGCAVRKEVAEIFHPFYRAIVHRDDVVKGALSLAAHWNDIPQQFINFGGPQVLSKIEFAECIRATHFHNLSFKVIEPDVDFFKNRPRTIAMISPIFTKLLGRSPCSLLEAARLEFKSSSNTERSL